MKVEQLYDEIYEKIARDHAEVTKHLASSKASTSLTEQEKEKLERMEFALQSARDILENMMTPGSSITIMHSKGSLTIEINE
ncbi:hypothetical protein ACFFIX_13235 [Metabacillus herbersteinensis]|uniref:Uncharacterized protein n=1 Tax=Metabacillus herbersteinensis TaxID=283816 RepID=A0ABV6GG09_9BACI